jgi:hypothetical protein
MFWNKKLILFMTAVVFVSFSQISYIEKAWGNEHGEEKPAEGGHGGGGGEHGGAAPEAEKKFSGNQTDEWMKVQAELTALKAKVDAQKVTVEGLIAAKAHSGGHATSADSENLKKEHEKLLEMIEEYNNLSTNFQNRFPEKGSAIGRVYKRIDPEDVDTMETHMSTEGRMNLLDRKIRKQYNRQTADDIAAEKNAQKKALEAKEKKKQHEEAGVQAGEEKQKEAVEHHESLPVHGHKTELKPAAEKSHKEEAKRKKQIPEESPVTDSIILQK